MSSIETESATTLTSGEDVQNAPDTRFYVVAIGASAGGLDALEKLFSALPPDTGAAYVVIQHLSPDHKSIMDSLLARRTSMPVVTVEDGMLMEPDHVYLILAGTVMEVQGQRLRLTPREAHTFTLPIDVFFQSLTSSFGDHSLGVILSGTGSDGTRGAGAINEAGGLLIAQSPEDAKFDGMPRSVIATGLVDAILPLEEVAQRIVAHVSHQPMPKRERPPVDDQTIHTTESAMKAILRLLNEAGGINFEAYKPGTVTRRIERRMAVRQTSSFQSYLTLLARDRNELHILRREMLIPVTSFFRDSDSHQALQEKVIEPLVVDRDADKPIRVWCAGIATGEEAYSLAMLFMETFEATQNWPGLKIFATDVEQANLDVAGAGSYPESIAAEVSPARLERFFNKVGNRYIIKSELRQSIVFARQNMITDPPFTKMDLVVCRNVLIYFNAGTQQLVLRRLQYALVPGGHLFLGSSEALGDLQSDFRTISTRQKIWQQVRPISAPLNLGLGTTTVSALKSRQGKPLASARQAPASPTEMGFQALLKAYAPPPAVLATAGHEVLHFYGQVKRFLDIRPGDASLDINRILPDTLIPVASALLFKASREQTSVTADPVRVLGSEEHSDYRWVRLSAHPAGEFEGQQLSLLVFDEVGAKRESKEATIDLQSETTERIELLEHELAATRESLQATIEELETANEELQATNEELQASNEELQSSNEELQSVNEELNTVNAEYEQKIDILNRINADLENLAKVVASGTLFLDQSLHLTRFTPDATEIFRLRETDIGRPIADLNHVLDYPDWLVDLHRAVEHGETIEKAVHGPEGKMFTVRMLPYRIPSSAKLGLVVGVSDSSSEFHAERLQAVLDTLKRRVAVLDTQGRIQLVNAAWQAFIQRHDNPELAGAGNGANGLAPHVLLPGVTDPLWISQATEGLSSVLTGERTSFDLEYPCIDGATKNWHLLYVTALSGKHNGVVVSHLDITDWLKRDCPLEHISDDEQRASK